MSFLPVQKLKGNQPIKIPMVWVMHLEQDSADKEESAKSDDPNGIEGMMEEFIVHLAQAVKEAQQDEKHCYHCSNLKHFICECPLVKSSRSATHLNQRRGQCQRREPRPLGEGNQAKGSPGGDSRRCRMSHTDSLLDS